MSWRFSLLNRFEDPPGGITEGPAWNGEVVLFTHIHASLIYAYNPKSGEFSVYRENTNRTNGLAFDADGRLFGLLSEWPRHRPFRPRRQYGHRRRQPGRRTPEHPQRPGH